MGLIDFQHLHQQIKNKLFEISYKVNCFNKVGDSDISRYAETYFKNLFNIIYKRDGWNFDKAIKINQDTYDLYDRKNRVCIQITSNNRQLKKDNTIKNFEDKYLSSEFETLLILFISDKKPQKIKQTKEFDYLDFNIIEFASLIEEKCNQSELLNIRDTLFEEVGLIQTKNVKKQNKNIQISQTEFLRRKKLEKELSKELVYPNYWEKIDEKELLKYPDRKFKDSRFILRSIEDESYPNADGNSNWYRTFMYDFYERGILIWLDACIGTKAIVNKKGEWYIDELYKKDIPDGFSKVNIRILGKLPYKNIVYWEDGDEYYNDYHLYCKFDDIDGSPYEEIVYRYENTLGYYWDDLDIDKQIK